MANGTESMNVLLLLNGLERTALYAEHLLAGVPANLTIDGAECDAFVHKVEAVRGTAPHVLISIWVQRYNGTAEQLLDCVFKYAKGGAPEFVSATIIG
jgi:hypothetical protein